MQYFPAKLSVITSSSRQANEESKEQEYNGEYSLVSSVSRWTLSNGVCTTCVTPHTAIPYSQNEPMSGNKVLWCSYNFTLPFTTSAKECWFSLKPTPELDLSPQLHISHILHIFYVYIQCICMPSLRLCNGITQACFLIQYKSRWMETAQSSDPPVTVCNKSPMHYKRLALKACLMPFCN